MEAVLPHKNIGEGIIQEFGSIKILTISTSKYPFIENEYPKNFIKKSQLEHVFVDTKLKRYFAFSNLVTYDSTIFLDSFSRFECFNHVTKVSYI